MWYTTVVSKARTPLCQAHHVRLLHPVRFAGTSPPDSLQICLFTSANLCVLGVSALSFSALFHQSRVTNHKSRLSNFSAAPNSSPFQSLLTDKNRLCYTEPVLGKLAS